MEIEKLLKIIDAVKTSGLGEFKYEEGDTKIALKSYTKASAVQTIEVSQPETKMVVETPQTLAEGNVVKAPLVGTFYAAASEGAKPFIEVGYVVKKGQVLGIIEAMKLMNEIECEADGTVQEIYVKNQEMVEYGQSLFRIS